MNDMSQKPDTEQTDEERSSEIAEIITSPGSSLIPMLEKAQLEQMMVTARAFPRIPSRCMDNIAQLAKLDEQAARECVYALPRGGKPIIGPSIRFAEIAKQCWGNCSASAQVIDFDPQKGWIEAEGRFLDLETGAETKQRVRRRITDKYGRLFSEDMIIVTGNAASAIAMRNVILAGIPRPVWRKGYENAFAIAIDRKGMTFVEQRDEAMKAFAQYGATPDMVLGALGLRAIEDLQGEHLVALRGMFTALKTGEATPEEMFDPRKGRPFTAVRNPLANDDPPQAQQQAQPAGDQEQAESGQGDDAGDDGEAREEWTETEVRTTSGPAKGERTPPPAKDERKKGGTAPARDRPSDADLVDQTQAEKPPAKSDPKAFGPQDGEAYIAYARDWIAKSTSRTKIDNQWKAERSIRDPMVQAGSLTEQMLDDIGQVRRARIDEIAKENS